MGVKIGIVGAGAMGRKHLRALAMDARAKIVGVADAVEEAARTAATDAGATACRDLEDLAALGATAVFVTLPNVHHGRVVFEALDRGFHVFSEKPMATDLEEARAIRARVRRGDAVYQMGFNRRWAPAYRFLRHHIDAGFEPYSANARINDGDMLTPSWYTNVAVSGGFMYDTAVHLVDMIAWLIGPVESVSAIGRRSCYPDYDDIALLLRCRGDRPVSLTTCGHASWAAPQERLELNGDHALLASEDLDRVRLTTRDLPHAEWQRLPAVDELILWGYADEDRAFIDTCLEGTPPPVGVEDAFHSVAVLAAAYESIRRGGVLVPVSRE